MPDLTIGYHYFLLFPFLRDFQRALVSRRRAHLSENRSSFDGAVAASRTDDVIKGDTVSVRGGTQSYNYDE